VNDEDTAESRIDRF
jgi:hypothetical protein